MRGRIRIATALLIATLLAAARPAGAQEGAGGPDTPRTAGSGPRAARTVGESDRRGLVHRVMEAVFPAEHPLYHLGIDRGTHRPDRPAPLVDAYSTYLYLANPPGVAPVEPPVTPLVDVLGLEDAPVKFSGWIQNSFTANPARPADGLNFGVQPTFLANRWMGNQYYLITEDVLERDGSFNLGFRVDTLAGQDWFLSQMRGLLGTRNFGRGNIGVDVPQFFVGAHLPVLTREGLDIQFGRFYTIIGYEGVPAISRPTMTVPYLFYFGQPFTHLGGLSTLRVTERLQVFNGVVDGWDRFLGPGQVWGYLGGFALESGSGHTRLSVSYYSGSNQARATGPGPFAPRHRDRGSNARQLLSMVLIHAWNDRLTQVLETDQAIDHNGLPDPAAPGDRRNAEWYSFANWFLYDFNRQVKGVWRSEVFRDDDGERTGYADTFYEMTLGLVYRPADWVWLRPEARYDWAQFTRPYNAGVSGSQFTFGFDMIFLY